MNTTNKREQVWESLSDPEFRKQFSDEHINVGIAFQIRSLRNRRNLTQASLAELLNVKQPLVSAWENPNYGKYTLGTLKYLAKAFDVGLLVRFVPFSLLTDWTVHLKPDDIAPPSFAEEQSLNAWITSLEKNYIIDANQAYRSTLGADADANLTLARTESNPERIEVNA
jgi:transcriptional regulator with XRE-family HTH domain